MKGNFEQALKWTLENEGGVSDHPADPGGLTKWGITHIDWALYCRKKGISGRKVLTMTMDECADIYRTKYWDGVQGGELPAGVDYAVFDAGVMSGPSRAIKWLQSALGLSQTGKMSQAVIDAAARTDAHIVLHKVCDARLHFCKTRGAWAKPFKQGWASRIIEVRDIEGDKLRAKIAREHANGISPAPATSIRQGDMGEAVRRLQARLRALGYPVGMVDGIYGLQTAAAVARFQEELSLGGDPGVWLSEYDEAADTAPHLLPQRQELTAEQLAKQGDRTTAKHLSVRRWLSLSVLLGAMGQLLDSLGLAASDTLKGTWEQVQGVTDWLASIAQWGAEHPYLLIGTVAILALVYVQSNVNAHVEAVRNGDAQGPDAA